MMFNQRIMTCTRMNFSSLQQTFYLTIQRFPISFFFCVGILYIALRFDDPEILFSYLAFLVNGYLWFVAWQLFYESHTHGIQQSEDSIRFGVEASFRTLFYRYILATLFLLLIYWYMGQLITFSLPTLAFTVGLACLVLFAPASKKFIGQEQIWVFNYRLACHILIISGAGGFLVLATILSTETIIHLFAFVVSPFFYLKLIFVLMSFAGIILLGGIAREFDPESNNKTAPTLNFLLSYLLIPFLLIYAAILHAYFVKIVLEQSFPKGILSALVSAFGIVGCATYLASASGHEMQNRVQTFFQRYFFWFLIVPASLMLSALAIRIHQYGWTGPRFILSVECLSLFFCIVLSSLRNLVLSRWILAIAAFAPMVASVGAWLIG